MGGKQSLIDTALRVTDGTVMPRLFMFFSHGIAGDCTGYRLGARHPIMAYVTGESLEEALDTATQFITKKGWLLLQVTRGKEVASDVDLIRDETLRSAAAAAVDRGAAIVVYETEIPLNG
jgi:hypothetical protein